MKLILHFPIFIILSLFLIFFLPKETFAACTPGSCGTGQFCAQDLKNNQSQCVPLATNFSLPTLTPGSYVIMEDHQNRDADGSYAKFRIEVEALPCRFDQGHDNLGDPNGWIDGSTVLRFTKSNRMTYWYGDSLSTFRFCVKEQNGVVKATYSPAYDFTVRNVPFPPLEPVTKGLIEYPDRPNYVYMGRLGTRSYNFNDRRDNYDSNNLYYGWIVDPKTIGFYPSQGSWTNWINEVDDYHDYILNKLIDPDTVEPVRTHSHVVWHSEIKPPERGGQIIVKSTEDYYRDQEELGRNTPLIPANISGIVSEDYEWGTNLPIYIKQIERSGVNDAYCWRQPYNCDDVNGITRKLTIEAFKKYEYLPNQKLKTFYVASNGSLTKSIRVPGNSPYRIRITNENDEPYFGFIQIRFGGGSGFVWPVDGYPIFIAGQDLIINPEGWGARDIQNGRVIKWQLRPQAANENISVEKKLADLNQPNIESIPWSDELTFTRDDSVSAPTSDLTPTSTSERTVSYRIAENPIDLDKARDIPYTDGTKLTHNFSGGPGLKSLWIRFIANTGRKEDRIITLNYIPPVIPSPSPATPIAIPSPTVVPTITPVPTPLATPTAPIATTAPVATPAPSVEAERIIKYQIGYEDAPTDWASVGELDYYDNIKVSHTFSSAPGDKFIFVRFKTDKGNYSRVYQTKVVYTPPASAAPTWSDNLLNTDMQSAQLFDSPGSTQKIQWFTSTGQYYTLSGAVTNRGAAVTGFPAAAVLIVDEYPASSNSLIHHYDATTSQKFFGVATGNRFAVILRASNTTGTFSNVSLKSSPDDPPTSYSENLLSSDMQNAVVVQNPGEQQKVQVITPAVKTTYKFSGTVANSGPAVAGFYNGSFIIADEYQADGTTFITQHQAGQTFEVDAGHQLKVILRVINTRATFTNVSLQKLE